MENYDAVELDDDGEDDGILERALFKIARDRYYGRSEQTVQEIIDVELHRLRLTANCALLLFDAHLLRSGLSDDTSPLSVLREDVESQPALLLYRLLEEMSNAGIIHTAEATQDLHRANKQSFLNTPGSMTKRHPGTPPSDHLPGPSAQSSSLAPPVRRSGRLFDDTDNR